MDAWVPEDSKIVSASLPRKVNFGLILALQNEIGGRTEPGFTITTCISKMVIQAMKGAPVHLAFAVGIYPLVN